MKILHSDQDIQEFLDQPSHISIMKLMTEDAPAHFESQKEKCFEWIPRLLLLNGSPHKGSKIQFGCTVLYLYKWLPIGFDMGIKEIKIMENMNEFLDAFNEINSDPNIQEKVITKFT